MQITGALEQLQPAAVATVRVRHGADHILVACSLWAASAPGQPLAEQCELPAAVGLRMGLVEQAINEAGLAYPKADLGLRARWWRVFSETGDVVGYELAVRTSAARAPSMPAAPAQADRTVIT